jgi:hypothetical protein
VISDFRGMGVYPSDVFWGEQVRACPPRGSSSG